MSIVEKKPTKSNVGRSSSAKPNKRGVPAELTQKRIAVTAYPLAEKCSFVSGNELQDWLEAERIQELSS